MTKDIISRLKTFCDCVDVTEKDVVELINVVSSATCWAVNPCETFLTGERTEYVDAECGNCPIEFTPYYHPFDPESFSFQWVEISDLSETYTDLDFGYIPSKGVFRVAVPECGCEKECGCKAETKLKVTYTAGYDEIPECLLPVMCNMLDVLHAKNKCDCGCGCSEERQNEEPIYAQGDIVTVQIETDLGKMIVADYKRQLGMISLCRKDNDIWGFVV